MSPLETLYNESQSLGTCSACNIPNAGVLFLNPDGSEVCNVCRVRPRSIYSYALFVRHADEATTNGRAAAQAITCLATRYYERVPHYPADELVDDARFWARLAYRHAVVAESYRREAFD